MDDDSRPVSVRLGPALLTALAFALATGSAGMPHPARCAEPAAAADSSRFTAELDSIYSILEAGDLARGETAARGYLRQTRDTFGSGSVQEARAQWLLARCLSQRGQSAGSEADSLVEASLRTLAVTVGPRDLLVAQSLDLKAVLLRDAGDLQAALDFAQRALAIREERLGPDHATVGKSSNTLGVIYARLGRLEEAREQLLRSHRIVTQTRGPDHRDAGVLAVNLAGLNFQLGNFREARALYEQGLAILEAKLGSDHPSVAACMQGLGNVASITGDYDQARRLYARGLEVRRKRLGPDHPDVADVLLNMAILECLVGDYAAAEQHLIDAQSILERGAGQEGPAMATALSILGQVRFCTERLDEAQSEHERSLALHERISGRHGIDAANVLVQLCKVKRARGNLVGAQADGEEGLATLQEALGDANPYVTEAKSLLAKVLLDRGDVERATALLQEAVATMDSLAADHPSTAWQHRALGDALEQAGRLDEAFEHWKHAEQISRHHVLLTAHTLSEGKALAYRGQQKRPLTRMLAHVAANPHAHPDQVAATWDAVIRSRSMVLDEMALRTQLAFAADHSGSDRLVHELARARSDLANLYLKTVPGKGSKPYHAALEQAVQEKERLEIELARASAAFAEQRGREQIGLEEVVKGLPQRSALLAYVAYQRRNGDKDRPAYVAFLSRAGLAGPVAIGLDSAGELHEVWEQWQREIRAGARAGGPLGSQAEQRYRQAATRLREIVWDPITPHLGNAGDVYIVPDGVLLGVSFAALPTERSSYLVQDDLNLHLLTTERDLIGRPSGPAARGILVLGAPEFDSPTVRVADGPAGGATAVNPSGQPIQLAAHDTNAEALRGGRLDCDELVDLRFRPLPNSASEASTLFEKWRAQAHGSRADDLLLTGVDASESALKQRASGKRLLHLATHGFFLGSSCAATTPATDHDETDDGVMRIRANVAAANPLLLSGMALAGANRRQDPFVAEDDGILTAEEVASLDLRGTELVVLSACDTGLGSVFEGEGVFGLRRALAVAGAQGLVMSLWAVEDRSAREFMQELYDARFARHLPTAQALRAAQLQLLERRRGRGLSTHPYFWAGFVATELGRSTNSPTSD